MELYNQIAFRENPKLYNALKDNSYYFKYLNRGVIDAKKFSQDMKILYKERTSDKIGSLVDNIDLISSVLDILK